MAKKKKNSIDKDALFVSAINAISGLTFEPDRAEDFKIQAVTALETLRPKKVKSEADSHTAVFILIISQLSGHIDIETKALESLRVSKYHELFLEISQIDFAHVILNEDLLKTLTTILLGEVELSECKSIEQVTKEIQNFVAELKEKVMQVDEDS